MVFTPYTPLAMESTALPFSVGKSGTSPPGAGPAPTSAEGTSDRQPSLLFFHFVKTISRSAKKWMIH